MEQKKTKPDILIFMSDQHNAAYSGYAGDKTVNTPNLDRLASQGTVFDSAYTSCPICVPARMSMLTGQLPEKTGIYGNNGAIPEDQATFIHSLAAEGYETVLIGRMHFKGDDQRHGFTKRLVGDFTPLYWGRFGDMRKDDLGPYVKTTAEEFIRVVGGGTSPVLEYDRAVIKAALEYLEHDHSKPQCIVVGTYAPHHTFVAPVELYEYYKNITKLPFAFNNEPNYDHPALLHLKRCNFTDEQVIRLRAAYHGMIENLDSQLGDVWAAWEAYLRRNDWEGVFVYLSDHGEQAGERNMYGKQTFFDGSSRIPLIFEGKGIKKGIRIKQAASITDIGPTLCEIAGVQSPPEQDGKSLYRQITGGEEDEEREVVSEYILKDKTPGRMIRKGRWKFISYVGYEEYDLLFDMESDPMELYNLCEERPEIAAKFRSRLKVSWDTEKIMKRHEIKNKHYEILMKWGKAVDIDEPERWKVPERARQLPEVY